MPALASGCGDAQQEEANRAGPLSRKRKPDALSATTSSPRRIASSRSAHHVMPEIRLRVRVANAVTCANCRSMPSAFHKPPSFGMEEAVERKPWPVMPSFEAKAVAGNVAEVPCNIGPPITLRVFRPVAQRWASTVPGGCTIRRAIIGCDGAKEAAERLGLNDRASKVCQYHQMYQRICWTQPGPSDAVGHKVAYKGLFQRLFRTFLDVFGE